jgi:hypothetical protein
MPPDRKDEGGRRKDESRQTAGSGSSFLLPPSSFRLWVRIAVVIWSAVLAVTLLRGLLLPKNGTTYWYFAEGGADWLSGKELYQVVGGSCRYSPLFHALMAPLALLPERLGALLWRMLNAGVFMAGMACWARMLLPLDQDRARQALLFLLALPLALGSINNAQANPLMTGLILLSLAAAAGERWSWSALCIALACLLKIYPVAVGLLLVLIYPRQFAGRFVAALALGLGLPFVLRDPSYVARQYVNWYRVLQADDRSAWHPHFAYRDLWLLFRLVGLPLSRQAYHTVQLLVAGMVAALCWWKARQGAEQRVVLNTILGLAACWMTLCGPATESCTYILLAPSLAWALLEVWHKPEAPAPGSSLLEVWHKPEAPAPGPSPHKPEGPAPGPSPHKPEAPAPGPSRRWPFGLVQRQSPALKGMLAASYGLFLASFMAAWFPGVNRVHGLGTHPLGALLLLLVLAWTSLSGRGNATAGRGPALPAGKPRAA